MKIIYLEDNPMDAALVKRYIDTTDHELDIINNIDETNNIFSESMDLFLVDILIDNQRVGLDLVQQLRQEGYNKYIVAVTALASPQEIKECQDAGCNAVLVKPYTISHLQEIIESL